MATNTYTHTVQPVATQPDAPMTGHSPKRVALGLVTTARPYQWAKNIAVLIVPGLAILSLAVGQLFAALAAFIAFSLAASSVYLLNDTLDRDRDRQHPTKRNRPIASGQVHPNVALTTAAVCAGAAISLAAIVATGLALVVASYLVLTAGYSVVLKHVAIIDVVTLAVGFVLRVLAGAVAIGVTASLSLLTAVFWGALLIALGKRHSEAVLLGETAVDHRSTLGIYTQGFLRRSLFDTQVLSTLFFAIWVYSSIVSASITSALALVLAGGAALALYNGLDSYRRGLLARGSGGDPTRELAANPGVIMNFAVAGLMAFGIGLL